MQTKKTLLISTFITMLLVNTPNHTMGTETDPNIYNNPEILFVTVEKIYFYFNPGQRGTLRNYDNQKIRGTDEVYSSANIHKLVEENPKENANIWDIFAELIDQSLDNMYK